MKKNKGHKFFIPQTRWGAWSVALIVFFIGSFVMLNVFVALGETGGNTFFSNLRLGISGLLAAICAISSFLAGITAIIKKERAFFVFISTTIGFLVLLFLLGEIIFPH